MTNIALLSKQVWLDNNHNMFVCRTETMQSLHGGGIRQTQVNQWLLHTHRHAMHQRTTLY